MDRKQDERICRGGGIMAMIVLCENEKCIYNKKRRDGNGCGYLGTHHVGKDRMCADFTEKIPTFKEWISKYRREKTWIGDLAKDVFADDLFPATNNYYKIVSYLNKKDACDSAMNAFEECYHQYVKQTGMKPIK